MVPHHHAIGVRMKRAAFAFAIFAIGCMPCAASSLLTYETVGDAIPRSLTGTPGNPVRGRAVLVKRESTCLLCHSGPFPDQRFQGNLSPDLTGAGSRWSEGELRLRMVDAAHLNPDTIMPSFYKTDGLTRVAPNLRGKPVLTACLLYTSPSPRDRS